MSVSPRNVDLPTPQPPHTQFEPGTPHTKKQSPSSDHDANVGTNFDQDQSQQHSQDQLSISEVAATPRRATIVSSIASHQHQQEQELLLNFTVPAPPVSTKELTLAAGNEGESDESTGPEAPRTLWMGDLDPWLDESAIIDLWWQILGQEVNVKLIKPRSQRLPLQPLQANFAHSGYCFVEFPLFEAAQQALGLNGQLLPDIALPSQQQFRDDPDNQKKYFRLNWASGATLTAPIVESPEFSLFVGDLSASTTEAHLLLFFQKLFPNLIRTVRVMTDPITGKSRCFGFVRFTNEQERQRALVEMNGVWFGGRPLRVANATPRLGPLFRKNSQDPRHYGNDELLPNEMMYMQSQQPNHPSLPMQGYYHSPLMNTMGNDMLKMPYGGNINMGNMGNMGNMQSPHFVDPTNTTVFVGGLLSDVTDQTLYTLFKPFGSIIQIKLPPGKNCGFVKYSTREEAEDAILNMEGFVIGGHRVRLGWGRISTNNKRFHRHQMAQMQMQAAAAAAMSIGYDPNSVYAKGGYAAMSPQLGSGSGQVYAPMAVPMQAPNLYHVMCNPDSPGGEYMQGSVPDFNSSHHMAQLQARSRSLDNVTETAGGAGHSGSRNYEDDQLADHLGALSLDAANQYHLQGYDPRTGYNPYSVYPIPSGGQPNADYSLTESEVPNQKNSGSSSLNGKAPEKSRSDNVSADTTNDVKPAKESV